MTYLNFKKAALTVFALLFCLLADAYAQKRQAVIVMRSPGGGASIAPCDGAMELNYQIVSEAKLNNKDEVRMGSNIGSPGASRLVSRKEYEDTRKAKLRDFFSLRWGADGVFYAASVEGQTPVVVLPDDAKPQKNADQRLSSFYEVMFTGEARDGKQKRQISLPLRDILKNILRARRRSGQRYALQARCRREERRTLGGIPAEDEQLPAGRSQLLHA